MNYPDRLAAACYISKLTYQYLGLNMECFPYNILQCFLDIQTVVSSILPNKSKTFLPSPLLTEVGLQVAIYKFVISLLTVTEIQKKNRQMPITY